MKIIVLAGGLSTERDVSLASAAGICRTLLEKGHDAFLLDVFFGLENPPENLEDVFTMPGHGLEIAGNISEAEPDLEAVKASRRGSVRLFLRPNVIELCRMADITFIGLHGGEGENGKLQAAFDLLGSATRYTGRFPRLRGRHGQGADESPFSSKPAWTRQRRLPAPGHCRPFFRLHRAHPSGGRKTVLRRFQHRPSISLTPRKNIRQHWRILLNTRKRLSWKSASKAGNSPAASSTDRPFRPSRSFEERLLRLCKQISGRRHTGDLPCGHPGRDRQRMMDLTVKAFRALKLNVYSRADFLLDDEGNLYCLEMIRSRA